MPELAMDGNLLRKDARCYPPVILYTYKMSDAVTKTHFPAAPRFWTRLGTHPAEAAESLPSSRGCAPRPLHSSDDSKCGHVGYPADIACQPPCFQVRARIGSRAHTRCPS